jgi:hypothetical protein
MMLPISGRRVASLEVLADDDRKSGRATYDHGHGSLKHCPEQHPFRFWHSCFASPVDSELNNSECGEEDADEAGAEEDEDSCLLTAAHLQVPS